MKAVKTPARGMVLFLLVVLLSSTSYRALAAPGGPGGSVASFTRIDLYPNIETIGVAVSGANLPERAELTYRPSGQANWRTGHPLLRIPDGRLVGSLFGLLPATSYDIRVLDGTTEIGGSTTTQVNDLAFTPSSILYVDDDAPAGGIGSAALPFRTIQEGIDRAGPGTQVLVADGIYREALTFPTSGTAGSWVQVKAQGGSAILEGAQTLTGNVWEPHPTRSHVWFAKISSPIGYLARDQQRFYAYDDLNGLMQSRGHGNVTMNEGWFLETSTMKLFVRSADDPSAHTWQVPVLKNAFTVTGRDWIWIEGFEMRFFDSCGICTLNASHIAIRRNRIHNLQLGIYINWNGSEHQGNDTRIEFNEIYDPPVNEWPWNAVKGSSMEGTGVVVRGHIGAIVRNNDIHNFFNGIYTGSSAALEDPGVAFDVDIYNNSIREVSDDGLEPEGACINHRFRNNTIDQMLVGISIAPVTQGPAWVLRSSYTNFTGTSIKWDQGSDGYVLIYHNTFWTNVPGLNAMSMIHPVHNAVLRNNIFQGNGFAFEEPFTGSTGHDWNYDNWYTTRGAGSPRFKWENLPYNTITELCAATRLECKGHENLPGLANPGGGDLSLLPSSPNIDRGILLPGINDNFSGSAPDIGLHESAAAVDLPPTVSASVRAGANPTSAANVTFTVIFSEAVTGVDTATPFSDFGITTDAGITGASITEVAAVSGSTYSVTVSTGSGNGTLRLDIFDDDSVQDTAGNPLGGAGTGNGSFSAGETYVIDKTITTVTSIIRADPDPTAADTVHFTVTFSSEVTGVDAGDFSLFISGAISGAAIGTVSGTGAVYDVSVSVGTGDGSLRLDLVDNDSIVDQRNVPLGGTGAGNGNFALGESYTVNQIAPVVISSLRVDPDPTSADIVVFRVVFSEAVTGVDAGDFALTVTGSITGPAVTGISQIDAGGIYNVAVGTGTGNGTLRLDVNDDDSILDSDSKPLGGAGAGNGNFSAGEVYTVNKTVITKLTEIFMSDRANDGWVLESKETSSRGGTRDAAGTTINLGDDSKDRQYRAILHFSTSSLPDNAVITMAVLSIKRQGQVGADPFTTHGSILVDIRHGAFGSIGPLGIYSLQVTDFQEPASRDSVGVIRNIPVSGWYWSMLDSAAFPHINLTGGTQFRLRFQLDDNDNLKNDYLKFFSGNTSAQADRPQLLVEYYVP